ncbi:MAG: 4Fe-4S binding protein [Acidimicrobiales bacterium]|jgi:ferredoxin
MRSREAPVVVICGDVGAPPVPLRLGELAAQLRRELSGVAPLLIGGICEDPEALAEALAAIGPKRVVVGCRAASHRRGELRARLRHAGVAATGTEIVDLETAKGCTEKVALDQSVTLLSAAVARVARSDVEAPVKERTSFSVGGVSRRSLLRGINTARHFVAVWRSEHCTGGVACTACVLACPHGALRREAGRLIVDGDRCTGCGVCVAACPSAAFALPGAEAEGLSAAATVLVAAARRPGSTFGVAIACQHSKSVPRVGEPWLVLRVPSIEMVTAGWLLQLVSAGVSVKVLGCEDDSCEKRVADLEHFVGELGDALGFSALGAGGGVATAGRGPGPAFASPGAERIELGEPEATMQALTVLGALRSGRTRWCVEGPGSSLGVPRIDAGGCSLCEVCVGICPTGALVSDQRGAGSLRLSVEFGRCTGCGACVSSCPEEVINLDKAVDSALLAKGRHVVATAPAGRCERCGAPLVSGPSLAALRRRLGGAHPNLTGPTSICADCRLGGRSVKGNTWRAT